MEIGLLRIQNQNNDQILIGVFKSDIRLNMARKITNLTKSPTF
jgi:hypothetical protein